MRTILIDKKIAKRKYLPAHSITFSRDERVKYQIKFIATCLFFFLFINSKIFAFAGPCIGSLCVGDVVIDKNNRIGTVKSFPSDSSANYQVGTDHYTTPINNLTPQINDFNGISSTKKIVDEYNRVGTVYRVFQDGRAQYQVGSDFFISHKIEPEVEEANFIKKNIGVVDQYNRVGLVIEVFRDQRVRYQVGTDKFVNRSVVGEINELNGLKSGTVIVDSFNRIGTTLRVFRDGRVYYQIGSDKFVAKDVISEVGTLGIIAKGKVVIDSFNRIGTVLNAFQDGRIHYQVGSDKFVAKDVISEVGTLGIIAKEKAVIDSFNRIGTVLRAFQDGRISYRVGTDTFVSKTVSPQVTEINGLTASIVVVDDYNRVGTVLRVFQDGRVNYRVGTDPFVSSSLSKEVATHPTYQKDNFYSTKYFEVGGPYRFFENKKVQLLLVGGGTTVSSFLYSAVDRIEDYSKGKEIVDSRYRKAVVQNVFENGAVLYKLKTPEEGEEEEASEAEAEKLYTGKIYGFFLENIPNDLELQRKRENEFWLTETAKVVAKKEELELSEFNPNFYQTPYLSVASEEKIPEIKKTQLDLLNENSALINYKVLRNKVIEFLKSEE